MGGVQLHLLATPGETADAISVWLPEKRVLMTGDNFLRAFPNISPIRGARLRTPEDWIASVDKMIVLSPEHVVPGHTRPVLGGGAARAALTAYRDGIASVLDRTLQGMRKGERPDELVQHVTLPRALAPRRPQAPRCLAILGRRPRPRARRRIASRSEERIRLSG